MDKTRNGAGRRGFLRGIGGAAAGSAALAAEPAIGAGRTPKPGRGHKTASLTDLSGQVAVLADSGLMGSREVVKLIADAGATVVLLDTDTPEAHDLIRQVSDTGARALLIPTDVEDEASVVSAFATVQKTFGRLDVLVNCQGLTATQALTETSTEIWDKLQSVNLRSVFMTMREGVKAMVAAGNGGRVVNITTIGAVTPVLNGNEAYGSGRAGVTMLSKSAALDYARHGIRVNVLLAGAIPNKVRRIETGNKPSGPVHDGPQRLPFSWGTMDQIAAVTLFLASAGSDYVTGQALAVDGGFLLS